MSKTYNTVSISSEYYDILRATADKLNSHRPKGSKKITASGLIAMFATSLDKQLPDILLGIGINSPAVLITTPHAVKCYEAALEESPIEAFSKLNKALV